MTHSTSRLGLNIADATDQVSAWPGGPDSQAMGVLDAAVVITEGTISARPAASLYGKAYYATDTGIFYLDTGSSWVPVNLSVGNTNIAASQSTSSTTYTTLTTPDSVTVTLPANGLLEVWFQATWQESVATASRAAIFIGSNQLKILEENNLAAPVTQAASTGTAAAANTNRLLYSSTVGLGSFSAGTAYTGDVTTGQATGVAADVGLTTMEFNGTNRPGFQWAVAGPCSVFAAAGTYAVSVQFKASSGSVTASNRKLWVRAAPFG